MMLHAGHEGPLLSLKVVVRVAHHQPEAARISDAEDDEEKESMTGHFNRSDDCFLRG